MQVKGKTFQLANQARTSHKVSTSVPSIWPDECGLYFVSSFNADLRWPAQAWSVGIVGFQSNGFEVTLPSTLISNSTASISPIIFLNLPDGMAFQLSGMLLYFGFSRAIPIVSPLLSTGVSTNSRPDLFFCSGVSFTVSASTPLPPLSSPFPP